jgi:hypothetical protein
MVKIPPRKANEENSFCGLKNQTGNSSCRRLIDVWWRLNQHGQNLFSAITMAAPKT